MLINIVIDTDELDVHVSIPYSEARKSPVIGLVRDILVESIKAVLPRLKRQLKRIETNDKKS